MNSESHVPGTLPNLEEYEPCPCGTEKPPCAVCHDTRKCRSFSCEDGACKCECEDEHSCGECGGTGACLHCGNGEVCWMCDGTGNIAYWCFSHVMVTGKTTRNVVVGCGGRGWVVSPTPPRVMDCPRCTVNGQPRRPRPLDRRR